MTTKELSDLTGISVTTLNRVAAEHPDLVYQRKSRHGRPMNLWRLAALAKHMGVPLEDLETLRAQHWERLTDLARTYGQNVRTMQRRAQMRMTGRRIGRVWYLDTSGTVQE